MTKEEALKRLRKKAGCKNCREFCWCEVCTALESAWTYGKEHAIKKIKTLLDELK